MLQPYQQRVVVEYNELADKLNSLQDYLKTTDDATLELQKHAMTVYLLILGQRIDTFNQEGA